MSYKLVINENEISLRRALDGNVRMKYIVAYAKVYRSNCACLLIRKYNETLLSFEALQLQIYLVSRTIAVIDGIWLSGIGVPRSCRIAWAYFTFDRILLAENYLLLMSCAIYRSRIMDVFRHFLIVDDEILFGFIVTSLVAKLYVFR